MSLQENVKNWVLIDNNIREINEKLKHLREKRDNYNNNIIRYLKDNNLDNPTIKINDGILKFTDTNYNQPLTFKYLEECCKEYFHSDNEANNFIKFIKSQRQQKNVKEIKRIYK